MFPIWHKQKQSRNNKVFWKNITHVLVLVTVQDKKQKTQSFNGKIRGTHKHWILKNAKNKNFFFQYPMCMHKELLQANTNKQTIKTNKKAEPTSS